MKLHELVVLVLAICGAVVSSIFYLNSSFAVKATENEVKEVKEILCFFAIDLKAKKTQEKACRMVDLDGR